MVENVSKQLVLQRVRNRIIDYLEVASSFETQRQYQETVPVSVPNEMINQWADWVNDSTRSDFTAPIFTPEEQQALASFHEIWNEVSNTTPDPLPPIEDTLRLPQWERLRAAAEATLEVFRTRGHLPED